MSFADFEDLLKESMGLDAASIGAPAIARAVMERTSACDLSDPEAYWSLVSGSHAELQALIEAVVVPETWFFRDREAFSALSRMVQERSLPSRADGTLLVLSLPSSTGEEPYSIAMALLDAGVAANQFSIDAIDISENAIEAARTATYGKNSFRGQELEFRSRYFDTTPGGYRICERVRRQVDFRRGNLFGLKGPAPVPAYDAIFCRNLLIYFDRATQDRAVLLLERRLAPRGVLFVAPSETGILLNHSFAPVKAPHAFAFRKEGAASRPSPGVSRWRRPHGAAPARPSHPDQPTHASPQDDVSIGQPRLPPKSDPCAHVGMALIEAADLANKGHFGAALERCDEHLRQSGASAEIFHLMGLVRDASGAHEEAANCYRKALYLDPNHREVLIHLALLLERVGKNHEAQLLRKRANRLQGTVPPNASAV